MPTKQTIIVRSDLKMRRGKEIAQGSHASMAWLTSQLRCYPNGWISRVLRYFGLYQLKITPEQQSWLDHSFTKICLKCDSEQPTSFSSCQLNRA
jgi:PTH2 family peptidyl-tRNA hydrolase